MLNSFDCAKDLLLQIHQGLIDLNFLLIRASLRCCSLNLMDRLKIIPADLGIVSIVMSPVVGSTKVGNDIQSISVFWRRWSASVAHPGEVQVQASCKFFHLLFHGCGGVLIGGLKSGQDRGFAGILSFGKQ